MQFSSISIFYCLQADFLMGFCIHEIPAMC